jgi:hypothetical protein
VAVRLADEDAWEAEQPRLHLRSDRDAQPRRYLCAEHRYPCVFWNHDRRATEKSRRPHGLCILYGSHTPLDAATLAQLYGNHHGYVSAVNDVNYDNVKAGYILSEDAEANIFEAAQSGILKR